ncbi:MAG: NeuD/PglB/VioB family sugar acetyltransferase [Flavobacterium sp.]|nr:NeuD/PglB/VioB family sugar acetyltransferase [Flavobacterium sp.]
MYAKFLKRILDFLLATIGFLVLLPFFILITLFLAIANNGSPFFIQRRPGYKGKIFSIIKFKTMNDKKDAEGNLLSDAERLTPIGKFVRKTSLDEIPQLLNVIKGDMSLIGPRPLLTQYMHLYSPYQNRRHEVKPGITGWAQVNGRNAIDWETKFDLDVYYVENTSFLLDVKIIFKTIKKIMIREGINAADSATIEPFSGNTNVVIYGGGGHCKVLLEVFFEEQKYQVKGIYDDNPKSDSLYGVKVSKSPPLSFFKNKNCIVAIGDNATRKKIVQQLQTNYVMTIHPTAVISKFAKIGHGTQIMATAVVNPDTEIGHHCIINTGAIVEHDCLLGDYVHISPNATLGGGVKVGEGTQIGIGASVLPNLTIGKNVMVGAGAVVVENIPDNAVVVGVPGKIIKYQNENNGK